MKEVVNLPIETEYRFKDEKEYKDFLDQAPNESWLQNRSLGKSNHVYIPVFITEANADFIFKTWDVMNEELIEISNGVMCTAKIVALPDYPGAQEIVFTGSAATQFKMKADNHVEFDIPNAREKAIAKAFATKGNIFGRNLNRKYKVTKGGAEVIVTVKPNMSFRREAKYEDEKS